jgi:trehalose synthase
LAPRPLGEYAPACGPEALERIRAAAQPVAGARVLHLSIAGAGGRVPELLQGLLPPALDAGLEVEWRVLFGGPELAGVAAALQNGLQGAETAIDHQAWTAYEEACAAAVGSLEDGFDAVVVHDPAGVGALAPLESPTLWRCHLDASRPDPPAWERAEPLVSRCAAVVVADESFAPPGLEAPHVLPPGIDPLSPRNLDLAPRLAGRVLRQLGVDLTRPFLCHLMRMDRWKDPHATLEAFALAREELPQL